ncbi:MAG: hypothetical protein KF745_06425 [Phycisphaeraceae bacterium]|nr:hypothetical protein [Phycisphaeraceae bacterium]
MERMCGIWVGRVAVAAGLLVMAGCLERRETIRVQPDGAVMFSGEFVGDPADFRGDGDALPEAGVAGWAVSQVEDKDKDKDGKPRITRTASLTVPPGRPLPSTYLAVEDPRASIVLQFPTELLAERRADGTYYQLRRVYQRRADAPYTYEQRRLENNPSSKRLLTADADTLTDMERSELLALMKKVELSKQLQGVMAGIRAIGLGAQDRGLSVYAAAERYVAGYDTAPIAALLSQPKSEQRDTSIVQVAEDFTNGLHGAMMKALESSGLSAEQRGLFKAAVRLEHDRRAVTEDLSDERWEVRVEMPGEVIGHNGGRTEGSAVVWEFEALAIMDRDQEILVSSVVRDPGR